MEEGEERRRMRRRDDGWGGETADGKGRQREGTLTAAQALESGCCSPAPVCPPPAQSVCAIH